MNGRPGIFQGARVTLTAALIALALLLLATASPAQTQSERQALIDLYEATDGANWARNDGWLTDAHHCTWQGVFCIEVDGQPRVDSLDLGWSGLDGQLPESLGGLTQLTFLNVRSNNLSGTLPDDAWNLPKLRHLAVEDNKLSGTIPNSLLGLESSRLELGGNRFSGYRVTVGSAGGGSDSVSLHLENNRLDRLPPPDWLQGKSVHELNLSGNRLTGSIDLSMLPQDVRELDLSGNALVEITGLEEVALPSLHTLDVSENRLEAWPAGLASIGLAHLDVGNNRLTGAWPEWLSTMPLQTLDLAGNGLSGDLPSSVGQLDVAAINVGNNDFTGSIAPLFEALRTPDWRGNWLLAADNAFSGALPQGIDFTRFNNETWPNNYLHEIRQFGLRGLDLCWNEIDITPTELEAIDSAQIHRGLTLESCVGRTRQSNDAGMSGSWFNPGRSGEGLTQMLLDTGQVMVYWFTYGNLDWRPDEQMWLVRVFDPEEHSIGIDRMEVPEGGRFSLGFRQSARRDYPGPYRMRQDRLGEDSNQFLYEFVGGGVCVTGFCSWEFDTDRLEHVRLTRLAGTSCDTQSPYQQFSGAWYNPESSGEGFVVEVLPDDRIVVYWFTYKPDDSGHQAWMVGDGKFLGEELVIDPPPSWEAQAEMTLLRPVGAEFGGQFEPADVRNVEWGEFTIRFNDEDHGRVLWNSELEGYGSGDYPIERLARPMLADCE